MIRRFVLRDDEGNSQTWTMSYVHALSWTIGTRVYDGGQGRYYTIEKITDGSVEDFLPNPVSPGTKRDRILKNKRLRAVIEGVALIHKRPGEVVVSDSISRIRSRLITSCDTVTPDPPRWDDIAVLLEAVDRCVARVERIEAVAEAAREAEQWIDSYDDGPGSQAAAENLRHALKEAGL